MSDIDKSFSEACKAARATNGRVFSSKDAPMVLHMEPTLHLTSPIAGPWKDLFSTDEDGQLSLDLDGVQELEKQIQAIKLQYLGRPINWIGVVEPGSPLQSVESK